MTVSSYDVSAAFLASADAASYNFVSSHNWRILPPLGQWQHPPGFLHGLRQRSAVADERRDAVDQRLGGDASERLANAEGTSSRRVSAKKSAGLGVGGAATICRVLA